jgi:aldehyde:ferredoxin oxidoreductase
VKEANAGGRTGYAITQLGISALILEDKPTSAGFWILHLSNDGVKFKDASALVGVGVYETAAYLVKEYGEKVALALIGPGGEMKLLGAGIQNIDKDRVPSRIAARGGLGAVMGSKGIKAIVIDSSGENQPAIADLDGFRAAKKSYTTALLDHPQTKVYADFGTAAMGKMCHSFGGLPTRNFSNGQFEDIDTISGEYLRDLLLQREGNCKTAHACMTACAIRCSNVVADENDEVLVSPLEYETIGLVGSNLGIDDLDLIAKLNWQINDLGLDSIEMGAALGVAAEAGKMEFGDGRRALELIGEIREGTPLGIILGNGAVSTGKAFNVERVPAVKGQAMSAYDPRAIKGTGVTYATSPQGADHTSGLTIRAKIDHLDPDIQIEISRNAQVNAAGYDSLGVCAFAGFGFGAVPETIPALLNARYDWGVGEDILQTLGRETLRLERKFNAMAGFTSAQDRIPAWMTREKLQPHKAVFDVDEGELDKVFNWITETED